MVSPDNDFRGWDNDDLNGFTVHIHLVRNPDTMPDFLRRWSERSMRLLIILICLKMWAQSAYGQDEHKGHMLAPGINRDRGRLSVQATFKLHVKCYPILYIMQYI
jgi:hypothetical protein